MKQMYIIILAGILITTVRCSNNKDMNLNINNHLNDVSHIGSIQIKNKKEAVLNSIVVFDKWYTQECGNVVFHFDVSFWNAFWGRDVLDRDRIQYLKDSVLPKVLECNLLTTKLKEKVISRARVADPQNAGYLLTGSIYGKSLRNFVALDNYGIFGSKYFLDLDNYYSDDPEAPDTREISKEEVLFYHLSFIKLVNESKAVYKAHIQLTNSIAHPVTRGYLVLNLEKENNKWLIDNMYYIEKEDLEKRESGGYTLPDYFENKEAFETGVGKAKL